MNLRTWATKAIGRFLPHLSTEQATVSDLF
jgi:hypothetical protein